MVRASDIRDEASLRAWLEGRPREDAVAIAVLAAFRLAPPFWAWASAYTVSRMIGYHPRIPMDRTPIVADTRYRRVLLALQVSAQRESRRVEAALRGAVHAAGALDAPSHQGWFSDPVSAAAERHYTSPPSGTSSYDITLAELGGAPSYALRSSGIAARAILTRDPVSDGVSAAALMAQALTMGTPDSNSHAKMTATAWQWIASDAVNLERAVDVLSEPFRHAGLFSSHAGISGLWGSWGDGWAFWADWYEGYLTGKPLDIDLLEQVALIPSAEWDKGDDHVNGIIARLRLEHAISRTPNGEFIAVNPETRKLRIEVDTALPADIGAYARRKIRAAVDVFALTHNQYTALAFDLRQLRQAADDPEYTPVELFDECAAASRRLASRIRNGEVPEAEKDALIADYGHRIREAGADILANDPKTQEVLTARSRIAGKDALVAEGAAVRAAVDLLQPLTEGLLAQRLPEDAVLATDPAADADDRKVASVKLASRLARIAKVLGWAVSGTGAAIIGTAAVLEAIPVIQSSPIFQAALQAVYRYLGF
jgi:hypothetical protein